MRSIPTTIGMLSLSFISTGCGGGDAAKLGKTLEKICKDNCDCPENLDNWNDISNCKKACEGDALYTEALFADSRTEAPCAEFGEILKEIEDCNIGVCGYDYNPGCDYMLYYRLQECWPADYTDYNPYYNNAADERELLRKLMHPIPTATISGEMLHQAK